VGEATAGRRVIPGVVGEKVFEYCLPLQEQTRFAVSRMPRKADKRSFLVTVGSASFRSEGVFEEI